MLAVDNAILQAFRSSTYEDFNEGYEMMVVLGILGHIQVKDNQPQPKHMRFAM